MMLAKNPNLTIVIVLLKVVRIYKSYMFYGI